MSTPNYSWINTTPDLTRFCEQAHNATALGVDTEFIRERTFYPELSLIQLEANGSLAIIDPLSDIDLTPLKELFLNTALLKIFHAGRQDLEIIYQRWKIVPYPLYDTQVAAMFCGYGESISYQNLVASLLNIRLDKTEQHTDWKTRPLTEKQIQYALNDVRHLPALYHALEKLADDKSPWIQEELKLYQDTTLYAPPTAEAWLRFKKPNNFRPNQLYILKALVLWREEYAKKHNKARGHVVTNEDLMLIARTQPKTKQALEELSFGYKKRLLRVSEALFKTYQEAQQNAHTNEAISSTLPFTPATEQNIVRLLKVLLKEIATQHNLADSLLASTKDLVHFTETGRAKFMHGWRYDLFGEKAHALLHGQLSIKVENNCIKILSDKS